MELKGRPGALKYEDTLIYYNLCAESQLHMPLGMGVSVFKFIYLSIYLKKSDDFKENSLFLTLHS